MIKVDTKTIDVYNNHLLIPVNKTIDLSEIYRAIKDGKFVHVEISVPRAKRSLSANAYCWVLCQRIAEEMSKGSRLMRKEEVYRRSIQELFEPKIMSIPNEDVKDWKETWQSRGIGWICEDLGEATIYGHTRLGFYNGSSRFDTKQMARLIDGLVQDAEALGIDVMNEQDRDNLLMQWEKDRLKIE